MSSTDSNRLEADQAAFENEGGNLGKRKDATGIRYTINCPGCGMQRLLPNGIKFGDKFDLVTCIKCGSTGPRGRWFGKFVWAS